MEYKKFGDVKNKEQFIFQGDELVKCHKHYITNGHRDFQVNAIFVNGSRRGDKVSFKWDIMVKAVNA